MEEYDYIIIGSGFGGAVSALRLSEKGYKVLVLEKGKWFKSDDFPNDNTQIKRWIWAPFFGMYGLFKMTFLNHVYILSGVGVGGGSLTYAATLPIPKSPFFNSGSWKKLRNWKVDLEPFYALANQMLGTNENPYLGPADKAIEEIALESGRGDDFEATNVGIYFGKNGIDPFFDGEGPVRNTCTFCGQCMTGCKENAKNTLDKNYLYLAQKIGCKINARNEVVDVQKNELGYVVTAKIGFGWFKTKKKYQAKGIIFAGGVLGTVPLLLKLKQKSLPNLSNFIGKDIRTNNEALIIVTSLGESKDYTKGIAIGSKYKVDENSHLEPVRYGKKSHFFKGMTLPMVSGKSGFVRFVKLILELLKNPLRYFRFLKEKNYADNSIILLFMQSLDSTIELKLGWITWLKTKLGRGVKPTPFMPEALKIAELVETKTEGKAYVNILETLSGAPTTAHILGGAVMSDSSEKGVINERGEVFGYDNMYICDGSMISANPGVNPSLTITAISEFIMKGIKEKKA